jgi:hypothetical protein
MGAGGLPLVTPVFITGAQSGSNFDLLGLVSKAVEVYQKLNGDEELIGLED